MQPGRLRLESRNLHEITDAYPEVRGLVADLGMREAVLDGEIVAFDEHGRPSFERLQRRMHVTSPSAVRRLAASTPVVYAIFDLLYLDGHSLMGLPYRARRERLEALELGGPAWRVPGRAPRRRRAAARGDRARRDSRASSPSGSTRRYEPGRRTGAWIKVKHTRRQELVIGGWIPGEGRRAERIGALLMGYYERGRRLALRGAGRHRLHRADARRPRCAAGAAAPRGTSPFAPAPKLPREAQFVEPSPRRRDRVHASGPTTA